MPTVRKRIALDQRVVEEILAIAGPEGFSQFVNHVLRMELQRRRIEALEEELAREHGPISPEVKAWVDAIEWPR